MALGPGRFAGVVRDVASTTAQRGFPSRRASGIGGTGFVPTHLPGCELWLDAADTDTITSSSGAVSQWNDKSGFGRNVSQATSSAQPGTGSATQNGLNVLTFDGGDRLEAATAADWTFLHNGTSWIAAVVAKAGSSSNPNAAYSVFSTNGDFDVPRIGVAFWFDDRSSVPVNNGALLFSGPGSGSTYQTVNRGADVWTPNTFVVASIIADLDDTVAASRSAIVVNDSAAVANNTSTISVSSSSPTSAMRVGGAATGFNLVGSIAELAIVSGLGATDTARRQLHAYLNAKWAVY